MNKKLMALLHKLKMTPEASDTSKTIYRNASIKQEELWKLNGAAVVSKTPEVDDIAAGAQRGRTLNQSRLEPSCF